MENNSAMVIAQISDSHLFADPAGLHCGVNVYQNLLAVLFELKNNSKISHIIFTGDLTQDHSDESYQQFVQAIETTNITVPIHFLLGNHDEPELFKRYLVNAPFCSETVIENSHWQIILLNSKSETPAGVVDKKELAQLKAVLDTDKSQLLFMHHHPIDVGYFIDKHGLKNKESFWQAIDDCQSKNTRNNESSIKGIACGHIHQELTLTPEKTGKSTTLYTCPATSIQFDPTIDTVSALPTGPGYRLFYLSEESSLTTEVKYLPPMEAS